ncbi:PREDICTED: UBX domain-containing protein 1-B [Papilio polytes]|uniref:UBX domain-containing protein 1-B n=1 Tax=Papilio polytes TaxID=76194 RepID=UPI00067695FE|nr:PREDICTED: UBX domain-containing protein 1-B [Papilio polytes]
MHWYGGSIAEAVALSKQRNAIFVVFVEGDNEQSAEMSSIIDNGAVEKRLSDTENFLAIKLKSGSINYTHFAQIYQFVPVPSLFFINRNGTPLEVVCAGVEAQNLATRIDRILEEHNKDKKVTVQPSTSGQNLKQQTANLIQAEAGNPGTNPTSNPGNEMPPTTASTTSNETKPAMQPACSSSNENKQATVAASNASNEAKPTTASASISSVDAEPETSSGPAAKIARTEFHEVTRSGQEYEVVCDDDVCVRKPKGKLEEPGPSNKDTPANKPETPAPTPVSEASSDEKVERAKELIEAVRKEKLEKEKELEKQKELERRAVGQGVAELKKWQADQELKQLQEERKREKLENNLARQRILEQIAQDRAERRARDQPPHSSQPAQPPQPQPQPPPTSTVGDGGSRARVQFKMADGNAHTAHFDVDTTLLELRRYVATNLQLRQSEFSLWTAFPRQELTEEGSTLRRRRGNIHRLAGDANNDDDNNTWNGNSTQQM